MRARLGKPTKLGYTVFGILVVVVIGIVVGVLIGGGTGFTIDAVGGLLLVIFIFLMFGANTPRRPGDDPRDHGQQPPGPTGLH